MKKMINTNMLILLGSLVFSCATPKSTSVIYSDSYDKLTDFTSVTMLPFGVIKIPGKWVKTSESDISGQHFFVGKDSVKIAIALQLWNKYEFSHNNPKVTPENFVEKFYEWDATYMQKKTNGQLKIVKENKEKNYIIWSLSDRQMRQTYFLFGLKGKVAYNLNVVTNKWNEDTKVKFLEKLFSE